MIKALRWSLLAGLIGLLAWGPLLADGPLRKGSKAPHFNLKDVAGKKVSLKDLAGKVVYVEFWSTTCSTCREALPHTQKLAQSAWAKKGSLVVLGINCGEERAEVVRFMKSQGFTFRAPLDTDGKVGDAYQADEIPLFVVIDKQGRIYYREMGYDAKETPADITSAIYEALRKK